MKEEVLKDTFERIKLFLHSPESDRDNFWESSALIWIDWREFEEDILRYLNDHLPLADKIVYEIVETDKPRGIDIILKKGEKHSAIPYKKYCTDRDTTLKSAQEYLTPEYQIRWYMGSLGGDTLAFCLLPTMLWGQLEKEFTIEHVAYYFAPIQAASQMFEMKAGKVCKLLKSREEKK